MAVYWNLDVKQIEPCPVIPFFKSADLKQNLDFVLLQFNICPTFLKDELESILIILEE